MHRLYENEEIVVLPDSENRRSIALDGDKQISATCSYAVKVLDK